MDEMIMKSKRCLQIDCNIILVVFKVVIMSIFFTAKSKILYGAFNKLNKIQSKKK